MGTCYCSTLKTPVTGPLWFSRWRISLTLRQRLVQLTGPSLSQSQHLLWETLSGLLLESVRNSCSPQGLFQFFHKTLVGTMRNWKSNCKCFLLQNDIWIQEENRKSFWVGKSQVVLVPERLLKGHFGDKTIMKDKYITWFVRILLFFLTHENSYCHSCHAPTSPAGPRATLGPTMGKMVFLDNLEIRSGVPKKLEQVYRSWLQRTCPGRGQRWLQAFFTFLIHIAK